MAILEAIRKFIPGVVLAAGLSLGSAASAAVYPTFTLDLDQSSVSATTSTCLQNCGVSAAFTQSSVSVNFTETRKPVLLKDIIEWTFDNATAISAGTYNIALRLVFTAPDYQSTNYSGSGIFATFMGVMSGGVLNWTNHARIVVFDQGSWIVARPKDDIQLGFGPTVRSSLDVFAWKLVPLETPSPAPVPPALPVMLLALGGMVYMGRRQKNAAAKSA